MVKKEWEPWKVYPRLLTSGQCDDIIAKHQDHLEVASTDGDESRVAEGRFFDDPAFQGRKLDPLYERFKLEVKPVYYTHHEKLHIVKYGVGGHYDWHADNEWKPGDNRKIAVVIALNDGYIGGGTEFMWPHPGKTHHIDLKKGDALAFLPTLFHRGVEVLDGERWILVCWATGRPFS